MKTVWLRLAATASLLAVLLWIVDSRAVWTALADANLPLAGLALLLVQIQVILSAWRWRWIAAALGLPIAPSTAVGEYYLATFLNQVLPGGIPGDVTRAVRLSAVAAGWRPIVRSIVLERTAGQIALAAVAMGGLLAWPSAVGGDVPMVSLRNIGTVAVSLALAAGLVVLLVRHGPAPVRSALTGLWPDLRGALVSHGAWRRQIVLNLLIVASYIATFALAAAATGAPLPAAALITVVPLVLFSMAIPATVGGWGLREGTAAVLWPLLGLEPAAGVAAGVLYGLILLLGSLPGLVVPLRNVLPFKKTATDRGSDS